MSNKIYINDDWIFTNKFSDEFKQGKPKGEKVRIPHIITELPFNYINTNSYQMVAGYYHEINVLPKWSKKRIFINVDGAAHVAEVFVNGQYVGKHEGGYTAFKFEITKFVNEGKNNLVIKVDSRDSLNIPPFGNVVDYCTYGGIYRDVYLTVEPNVYINDCFAQPIFVDGNWHLKNEVYVENDNLKEKTKYFIYDEDKKLLQKGSNNERTFDITIINKIKEWNLTNPHLYYIEYRVGTSRIIKRIGFRTIEFKEDGFYLNNEKVKIVGLNRHQLYPYVGYAMTDSIQQYDASILKNELHVNAVRTSHYPQSQAFIDKCDELGILVFTETVGWQNIGDKHWQDVCINNVKEMVTQYRHHPSIIAWGVRVNESDDNEELYTKTNEIAHQLDPYRPTSGVRCFVKSQLLEDIYAYNDFTCGVNNRNALQEKKDVLPDKSNAGYLVTEYGGHMIPAKTNDSDAARLTQAVVHATVLNSALDDKNGIAGSFGWCMNDYNTNNYFGSGDNVCYHGVLDMFRNKKLAAYVYATQSDNKPIIAVNSDLRFTKNPNNRMNNIYCFTNGDRVDLYRDNQFVKSFFPDGSFENLKHAPVVVDDIIGELLTVNENINAKDAEKLKEAMYDYANNTKYAISEETAKYVKNLKKGKGVVTLQEFESLINKYIYKNLKENVSYRFDAMIGNITIASATKSFVKGLRIKTKVSNKELIETKGWDASSIRIQIVDENDNVCVNFNDSISIKTTGPIKVIGPTQAPIRGGLGGLYIKSMGKTGNATLTLSYGNLKEVKINFRVKKRK